jgi:ATP-dependent DNA helicase PIF1
MADSIKVVDLGTRDELTREQTHVLECLDNGTNVFMTGGGGVGKSFVIKTAVERAQQNGKTVAITASTGVAADMIGGTTLHALLGLGLAKDPVDKLVACAFKSSKLQRRWRGIHLLVVDEVSMLDPDFFTAVDRVARALRRQPTIPFGGIQLLLSGDFFQLPPVMPRQRSASLPTFCFETEAWRDAALTVVQLTHIFRQHDDASFAALLNRARRGDYTHDDVDVLVQRVRAPLSEFAGIEPTRLYARRANVDEINEQSLRAIDCEDVHVYRSTVHWEVEKGVMNPNARQQMVRQLSQAAAALESSMSMVKQELTLKVGAQVMLVCNLNVSAGLVNGSRGVVVRFALPPAAPPSATTLMPVVQFAKGQEVVVDRYCWEVQVEDAGTLYYRQVPLQLAWAVTIHKAQGLSLDCVELQLDNSVFEYGQAYVALSRVRSLAGLTLTAFAPRVLMAHPTVKAFYATLSSAALPASQSAGGKGTGTLGSNRSSTSSSPVSAAPSSAVLPSNKKPVIDPFTPSKKARVELF